MANVLPWETRERIIAALSEGNSVRAVERLTDVPKSTILRLALAVGDGCERLHNRLMRGVKEEEIELDEQWSFIAKKEKRLSSEDPAEWGDVFTYSAFGRKSKAILSWAVGKRTQETTNAFVADLRARVLMVPLVTSDGLTLYVPAVASAFAGFVDYAQVVKRYGYARSPDHKYEPAERYHCTARHINGRKRRLCLAFSKTMSGYRAAVALSTCVYNLTRIHASLRITPAMACGVVDGVWTIRDLIEAALSEKPSAPPVRQPLTLARETGPVRQLPNDKGFLRLVSGEGTPASAPPSPASTPPPVPIAPVEAPAPAPPSPPVPTSAPPVPKPAARKRMVQLDLFPRDPGGGRS